MANPERQVDFAIPASNELTTSSKIMKILNRLDTYLFVFAAIWGFGASLYWLLSPVTIHEITAQSTANGSQAVEETVSQASWYQVQGAWGIAVLVIFVLLFLSIAMFAMRNSRLTLAISSILAIVITFLAGLSIGSLYLPAVIAVIAGWSVIGLRGVFRGNPETQG